MTKRMLIDATHDEETRVVMTENGRLIEFDYESKYRKPLKGSIFLAKVTRVEPSLQAAFVNFGGNRHGFLPFSEIHPDYFRIPVSDREALMEEQEEALREHDEKVSDEEEQPSDETVEDSGEDEDVESADQDQDEDAEEADGNTKDDDGDDDDRGSQRRRYKGRGRGGNRGRRRGAPYRNRSVEMLGDDMDGEQKFRFNLRRKYKIQEVVSRGQIVLVQVSKEERGNKGAAVSSYLSLPGRYCVLMPNSPRGGGVSRKIASYKDRDKMRDILKSLEIAKGMSVIVRTAGVERTKAEIKRDFDYLTRLWDTIRELTLKSSAPAMVYQEADLIKRAVRDLYTRDVDMIEVAGEDAYKATKDFMKMMIPSHVKKVQEYKTGGVPLFKPS